MADPSDASPCLVIAVDGFDRRFFQQLDAAGKMPCLSALFKRGSIHHLRALRPLDPYVLWSMAVTGVDATRHGILARYSLSSSGLIPVCAETWRAAPIWRPAKQAGHRVNLINWPATAGESLGEGSCVVSDRFFDAHPDDHDPAEQLCMPDDLLPQLNQLRVNSAGISREVIAEFCPTVADLPDDELRYRVIRALLARATTMQRVATAVMSGFPAALTMVRLDVVRGFCEAFIDHLPPAAPGIPQQDVEKFRFLIPAACVLVDAMIGRLIELAGEQANVIVVSEHGYRKLSTTPDVNRTAMEVELRRGAVLKQRAAPAESYRAHGGMMICAGTGIEQRIFARDGRLTNMFDIVGGWLGIDAGDKGSGATCTGLDDDSRDLDDRVWMRLCGIDGPSQMLWEQAVLSWLTSAAEQASGHARWPEAAVMWERVVKCSDNMRHRVKWCQALLNGGLLDEAEGRIAELEALLGEHAEVSALYGQLHAKRGEVDRALERMDEAARLCPDALWPLLDRVRVCLHAGRKEEARATAMRIDALRAELGKKRDEPAKPEPSKPSLPLSPGGRLLVEFPLDGWSDVLAELAPMLVRIQTLRDESFGYVDQLREMSCEPAKPVDTSSWPLLVGGGGAGTFHHRHTQSAERDGYEEARSWLMEHAIQTFGDTLQPDHVSQLHRRIYGRENPEAGKWRNPDHHAGAVAYSYDGRVLGHTIMPNSDEVVPLLDRLCVAWNAWRDETVRFMKPIVFGLFVDVLYIHPFIDGNGRTARLLTEHLLQSIGHRAAPYLALDRWFERRRPEYIAAVSMNLATTHSGDPVPEYARPAIRFLTRMLHDAYEDFLIRAPRVLNQK